MSRAQEAAREPLVYAGSFGAWTQDLNRGRRGFTELHGEIEEPEESHQPFDHQDGIIHVLEQDADADAQETLRQRYRRKKANQAKRWQVVARQLVKPYQAYLRETESQRHPPADSFPRESCGCAGKKLPVQLVRFSGKSLLLHAWSAS